MNKIVAMKNLLFWTWGWALWVAGCQGSGPEHDGHVDVDAAVYYTCSMHPEVREPQPGNCPICRMPLIAVAKTELRDNEIRLNDRQMELGNIRLDTVRARRLVQALPLTGSLTVNPARTRVVSARAMGRLDRLYVKALGDYVRRGAPLFDLYSDELALAKQELSLAAAKIDSPPPGGEVEVYRRLHQAARSRLRLWGLSEAQLAQVESAQDRSPVTTFFSPESGHVTELLATEGAYVMEGSPVVQLTDLRSLWVQAQVYGDELSLVRRGMPASVEIPANGGSRVGGRIEFVNPEFNADSRITLVRVEISNPGGRLRPGMLATVHLQPTDRSALALPTDAVIREARGNTVWLETEPNTFRSVMVELGLEQDGWVEIRSGLRAGDRAVVSGAYLVNSEYVFKKGAGAMEGHGH
jgi:Cu(I)/Ag(I) efflux system membrane fusion protein